MAKTRTTARTKTAPELPEAFHRITALLHTMRCIAQQEDRLCLLRNEIKRTQTLGPRLARELHALLQELPAEEYTSDLHEVEAALSFPCAPAKAVKNFAKKTSRPTPTKRTPNSISEPA